MAIVTVPVPVSARQAASTTATVLDPQVMGASNTDALRSASDAPGLRVFAYGGRDLSESVSLASAARLLGWRLRPADPQGGVVTVREAPAPAAHLFSDFNVGPYSRVAWAAVAQAAAFASAHETAFELTFLLVPMLYVEAIWLRAAPGARDYLLVYGRHPEALRPNVFYPDREFVAALRGVAAERLRLAQQFPG